MCCWRTRAIRMRTASASDAAAVLTRDQQHLREILAVLRTRTRQDFGGYKKPTVLRRVQRRMGLSRITRSANMRRCFGRIPSR